MTEFLLLAFVITQYIGLALCFRYIFKQKKEIDNLYTNCVHYFADTDVKTDFLQEVINNHLMVQHGIKRSDLYTTTMDEKIN